MTDSLKQKEQIKVIGKSWVINLPDDFTTENNLAKDTKVLLTFKENEKVEAEILPPLSEKLKNISDKILKRRKGLYGELKRLGD
ncbi:MAG: hypothetical protein ACR2F2_11760 [Pyrinomonadaceae bacterium]